MRNWIVDFRDSVRGLARDRGFSATVVLTLAITIGAATAAFSIVNGILLKPLGYPEPDRLVALREVWHEVALQASSLEVNGRHFEYWRQTTQPFDSMAQFLTLPANLTSGGPAVQIAATQASGSLFEVLEESAAIGRVLTPADDRPESAEVAVIGDALWRQRFGASPGVVGSAIVIDGTPYTVVGVLRPTFRLPERQQLSSVDVVVPMRVTVGWVGEHNNAAVGRLKPNVRLEEAQAELDVLQRQAADIATAESPQRVTLSAMVRPLTDSLVGRARRGVLVLFAAIVAVLAIACANLTNLALIRAMERSREAAIRSALGAGRARLIARALLDFALLAGAGGAAGVWVAYAAIRIFVSTAPIDLPRIEDVSIDARVLAFAATVTGLTGLLVAVLPMRSLARRGDLQSVLRSGSAAGGHGPAAVRARAILTGAQVALTVTLLTVTALLGASLLRVLNVDPGFNTDRVLAVSVALPAARYDNARARVEATDRIIAGVQALPGVRSVTSTSLLPMRGEAQVNFVVAAGSNVPRSEQPTANFRFVAPDYFTTLQIPVQRGRMFALADRDRSVMPAVVSASLAERLWPGRDALGQQFGRGIEGEAFFEVVGIAPDARTTSLEHAPPLMVYVPYWWQTRTTLALMVKTELDPVTLAPSLRRALDGVDPEIAIGQPRLLQQAVEAATSGRRYQARLFAVFGAAALLIATLGVYGVTAYSVSKRRREMNIRVALGARPRDVRRLLMQQSARAVVPGVIAGLGGALIIGSGVAGLLYEVQPRDPGVLGSVAAIVALVAFAASHAATRRGLSLNPAAALREE